MLARELLELRAQRLLLTGLLVPAGFSLLCAALVFSLPGLGAPLPARTMLEALHALLFVQGVLPAANAATLLITSERQEGTIEAVLATPVSLGELLIGKALAAALPGPLLALGVALLEVPLAARLASAEALPALFPLAWWLAWGLVAPLGALLASLLALGVATRLSEPRLASFAVLAGLPSTGALVWGGAVFGVTVGTTLLAAGALAGLCVGALWLNLRLLSRDLLFSRSS